MVQTLLLKLNQHVNNRLETRDFLYMNVISWLESKISNMPVQDVIRGKFLEREKESIAHTGFIYDSSTAQVRIKYIVSMEYIPCKFPITPL